jgi:predicted phage baseplate assembly protein
MPLQLEAPNLDNRTYEQILREARLRIPRYAPEWTDFNESDPGMTLVELFAWLTEMMLHSMNRIPDRSYIKFLQMLNMELQPAQPAVAHLTFTGKPPSTNSTFPPGLGQYKPVTVLERFGVQAQSPSGDTFVFETRAALDLILMPLVNLQVFDGTGYTDVTVANNTVGTTFHPLGWVPQPTSALYLGFDAGDAATAPAPVRPSRVFPSKLVFRAFLPQSTQESQAIRCSDTPRPSNNPQPDAKLVWEYKPDNVRNWRRLATYKDETLAFTQEGYVYVQGPGDMAPAIIPGKIAQARYWLRCRVDTGSYPPGHSPEIDLLRPNTVPAENLTTATEEWLGTSSGFASQTFALRFKPVQPQSLQLYLEDADGRLEEPDTNDNCDNPNYWCRVDDFLSSGPSDRHYTLNATLGEIKFGDGRYGLIPLAGYRIIAGGYRYGGGGAGNVPGGAVTTPLRNLDGLAGVTNERPAEGGRDEESLEHLKMLAPHKLRTNNRAMSGDDFAALAREAGGVARAIAIPLMHPDHPGVDVPGCVTVVIVPDRGNMPPRPSADLLRSVCTYLESRRLLTTEIHIKGPEYLSVRVSARIAADPYAAFDEVRRNVTQAINDYLSPLPISLRRKFDGEGDNRNGAGSRPAGAAQRTGSRSSPGERSTNADGWAFGQEFNPNSLYSVIYGVADVKSVSSLSCTVDNRPFLSVQIGDAVTLRRDELVYGVPDHDLQIDPYEDLN